MTPLVERELIRLTELHAEYVSMVKLFKFAVEKAENKTDKEKFLFNLKICESMVLVLSSLFQIAKQGE